MKKSTLFVKNSKFNFFKRNFAIHKVGDSKDLEFIERRNTLLLKNFSRESELVKSHNKYIDFVVKNKNLEIDDNNGKYFNDDDAWLFIMLSSIPTMGLSVLLAPFAILGSILARIEGYVFLNSDKVDYLEYKLLSDESFMKHIDKQNEIENIEKIKI